MYKRQVPIGTVLRKVFTEVHRGEYTLARQVGSYPLLVEIPMKLELRKWVDIVIIDHGFRSVTGLPCPFNINNVPPKILRILPKMTKEKVNFILRARPIKDKSQLRGVIPEELVKCIDV